MARAFDLLAGLPEDLKLPGREKDKRRNARGCNGGALPAGHQHLHYIRRKKPEKVLRRFRTLRPGEAVLSVITFGELVYGAEKSAQRGAALELLAGAGASASRARLARDCRRSRTERFARSWNAREK